MYHSKKIGVFISHIFGEYQKNICQGIADRAAEYGYLTEIFALTDGEDLGAYSSGEKSILRIPRYDAFSGVIFASGTYLQPELRAQTAQILSEKCSCPILEITQSDPVFPSLCLGNSLCTENIMIHLIEKHRCRRICYLGNSLERVSSDPRRAICRRVMERYGLSFGEEDSVDCTYSRASIASGLASFLQKAPRPDAIVCYNDRMAVLLMELLTEQKLKIPEDICVTGFDDLEIGRNCSPDLTTVTFPIYEMGVRAFDLIHEALDSGNPMPEKTVVRAEPIYRASCCAHLAHRAPNPLFYENRLLRLVNTRETAMLTDIKLSALLHSITDLEDGMDLLEDFVSTIESCREFYICLYPGWNHIPGNIRRIASAPDTFAHEDQLWMPFAFRDHMRLPGCRFLGKNILPDYLYREGNAPYLYFPLFYTSREFGYAAMTFDRGQISATFSILLFLRNINAMLERVYDNQQMSILVHRLEDISGKDELTQLPSRSGFRLAADRLLRAKAQVYGSVMAMQLTLSDIPEITAQSGRAERDFAICVAGHALENAISAEDCISHQGGGEFLLLSPCAEERYAENIEHRINSYLKNYNKLHTKPYEIRVAITHRILPATDSMRLEEIFP